MNMVRAVVCIIVGLLLLQHVSVSDAELASTLDYCECSWNAWKDWSDCNSTCFGQRERTRSVQLRQNTGCDEFTDCTTNDEGFDWQDCNNTCHNGGVATGLSISPCACQPGFYSQCCTDRVNCGDAGSIEDGTVSVSSTYYGGTATYICNTHYNMSDGDSVRQCQNNFSWSGSKPTCLYANHCGSSPCTNGATCVELLGDFRCDCTLGWSGQFCENDIQPPVMTGCSVDVYINATDHTVQYSWTAPTFTDPMGTDLDIVSNYQSHEFVLPWGDHTVQYVATKTSNGLVTECSFKIKVRPTPCEKLNVPANGARLCNGWQTDYGQFCIVTCQQNYTLAPTQSYYTWYVCGASGSWIAASPVPDCEVPVESTEEAEIYQPEYAGFVFSSSCSDDVTRDNLQNLYIDYLQETDGFSSFCSNYPTECHKGNVDIQCSGY